MAKRNAKHGLGRGLGALIQETPATPKPASVVAAPASSAGGGVMRVPIDSIAKNTLQPRQIFEVEPLKELVASVKERGILQPLLVREVLEGKYELIAGERRLRAAGEVGLTEVPVVVLRARDLDSLVIAMLENIQREDLNIMEEAEGYQVLSENFHLTQSEIAKNLGKSRTGVANAMRLLKMHDDVKAMVRNNLVSAGHAKIIAGIDIPEEQVILAKKIVKDGMSVRGLEQMIKKSDGPKRKPRAGVADIPKNYVSSLSDKMHSHFGTAVRIDPCKTYANGKKGKGTIEIDFYSNDDLGRILAVLGVDPE